MQTMRFSDYPQSKRINLKNHEGTISTIIQDYEFLSRDTTYKNTSLKVKCVIAVPSIENAELMIVLFSAVPSSFGFKYVLSCPSIRNLSI